MNWNQKTLTNLTTEINSALIAFPIQNNEVAAGEYPTLIETIFPVLLYFPASGDFKAVQLAKICTTAKDKWTIRTPSEAFYPTITVN